MNNAEMEFFLKTYFTYEAILGDSCNKKTLIKLLGKFYFLTDEQINYAIKLTTNEVVCDLKFYDDYKCYKRICQYKQLMGESTLCSGEIEIALAMKGQALKEIEENKIAYGKKITPSMTVANLIAGAESGKIISYEILGFLQISGTILEKDVETGCENLKKALLWGSHSAGLALLYYSEHHSLNQVEILKFLSASVKNTPYQGILTRAESRYALSINNEYNHELFLLKKAMAVCKNKIEPNVYSHPIAQFVYSDVISFKDKERILLTQGGETSALASQLPLNISSAAIETFPITLEASGLCRKKQCELLMKEFQNFDLRKEESYHPICVFSSSEFILESYAAAISASLKNSHILRINGNELKEFEVALTKENVFLQNLSNEKSNVYLIVLKGEIPNRIIELVKDVLNSKKRSDFTLNAPFISLDLSSVLPICVCDKDNAKKLKGFVEFIEAEPLKECEMKDALRCIIDKNGKLYSIRDFKIEEETQRKLEKLPIEVCEKIIDKFMRENRNANERVSLTTGVIQQYLSKKIGCNNYGFGGSINENK